MSIQGDPTGTFPVFDQTGQYTVNNIYDVSPSFLGDLSTYFTLNPTPVPIDQVTGFTQIVPNAALVSNTDTTGSGTYVDLANPGPTITGLSDGTYVVIFGCMAHNTIAGNGTRMALQIDGGATADADGAAVTTIDFAGLTFATTKTLSNSPAGGHTLNCQYRVASGTGSYSTRYLVAIRISGA